MLFDADQLHHVPAVAFSAPALREPAEETSIKTKKVAGFFPSGKTSLLTVPVCEGRAEKI
jgi:hypothetical protein